MEKRVPKVQTVGHYRIVKQIGAGGMGVVFDAEDLKLGRHVALKFLPVSDTLDAHALDRFRREARTASALNHPNICTIYEIDEVEGQPLIAMELLEGQTLHSRLSESPLPIETACDIAIQIAAGLQAAHSKNIIHRDIKPANIFVTSYGTVKILDFGLAKLSHADDLDTNDATSSLTRTGTTLGTIAYMSPEQVAGEPLDCRSDLFSFGVVLYQMFSGRLPFSGATSGVVFDAILNREPLPLSDANPQVPPALANIVRKSLEKDRERRYQTASEIAGDLNQVRLEAQATGTAPFSPQAIRLNLDRNERKQEGFVPHRAGNRDIDRSSTTRSPRRNLLISALALLLIATLASGGWAVWRYRHPSQKSAPPSKNTIVLADFSNTTGDDVFAGTLKQALAADLDQTPFFNILSSEQVKEQLRLMGRKEDERMSADIAREVCLRAGGKAVLVGAISSLGAHYLVALNAIGCSDGDTLVRAQSEADARESVLNALQQVTTTVRKQLGESLESIKQYDIPLDRVTTPSLDALRMFTLGDQATDVGDEAGAIPFYQRAIALDPNFATAYESLGISYANLREYDLANKNLSSAYELRERVSQRERLSIEAIYHTVVTGNLRKAVDAYEVWGQAYPQALGPHTDLAVTYEKLGDQEKALQQMERAASLSSAVEDQANLAVSYMYCGRFSEAERILKRVVPDPEKAGSNVLPTLYGLAFANRDNAAMASLVRQSRGKAGAEDLMLFSQALTEYYFGRAAAGRDSVAQAIAAAHRDGEEEVALSYAFGAALSESEVGDRARAQAYLSASSRSTSPDMKVLEALVAARSGNISRAQKLSDELAKQRPSDTMLNEYWVPLIRASIELEKNHPAIVVDLLKPLASYDLSLSNPIVGPLYPAYVRGQALLRLGQGEAAAAEFEKLLSHRGLVQNSTLGSLAYLGKARALAMGGDTNASKAAYQQFLALWKDADPGLKLRAEATAEYVRLQ